MSTELHNNMSIELPRVEGLKVGIVAARWNNQVTEPLLNGAIDRIVEAGYSRSDITVQRVPGTVELTFAAAQMARSGKFDAVIMIGCVIRGGTPHFDYVCDNATQGCALLNATQDVPIIYGLITTNNMQQALDRCGGRLGNKGDEAAVTAIKMADFRRKVKQ